MCGEKIAFYFSLISALTGYQVCAPAPDLMGYRSAFFCPLHPRPTRIWCLVLAQLFDTRHGQVIEYRHEIGYTYATDTQISAIKRHSNALPTDLRLQLLCTLILCKQAPSPTKSYLIIARGQFTWGKINKKRKERSSPPPPILCALFIVILISHNIHYLNYTNRTMIINHKWDTAERDNTRKERCP